MLLQDDEEFEPGKGVAEMIGKLESGEPLGKDPRYEGLNPESYEAFQKRMLKYQQAYEAQYLDRKDWKVWSMWKNQAFLGFMSSLDLATYFMESRWGMYLCVIKPIGMLYWTILDNLGKRGTSISQMLPWAIYLGTGAIHNIYLKLVEMIFSGSLFCLESQHRIQASRWNAFEQKSKIRHDNWAKHNRAKQKSVTITVYVLMHYKPPSISKVGFNLCRKMYVSCCRLFVRAWWGFLLIFELVLIWHFVLQISLEDYKEIVNLTINEDHPPWKRPEITKVQPAPDWPDPLLQKQFDRAQWIMFLLRKTYLRPDPNCPSLVLHETGMETLIFNSPYIIGAIMQHKIKLHIHSLMANLFEDILKGNSLKPQPTDFD